MNNQAPIEYVDDAGESIGTLIRLRAPALMIGLVLGMGISFLTSGFEQVLEQHVHVAIFLPFVTYISDAIETQTEAIYIRELKSGQARFRLYLRKESIVGIAFGLLFAVVAGGVAWIWLNDPLFAIGLGSATILACTTAPLIALIVTQLAQYFHEDPAADSGPIATVIQNMCSVIIYGLICSWLLL
jgi:magnesium transporter